MNQSINPILNLTNQQTANQQTNKPHQKKKIKQKKKTTFPFTTQPKPRLKQKSKPASSDVHQ
jgi:hypothetical protein